MKMFQIPQTKQNRTLLSQGSECIVWQCKTNASRHVLGVCGGALEERVSSAQPGSVLGSNPTKALGFLLKVVHLKKKFALLPFQKNKFHLW